ncbi:MAG: hypothetical protein ACFFEK_10440 [Candidatus Thorarchaeota archaeon]
MSRLRNAPRVLATVIAIMIFVSSLQTGVMAQTELNPIVVLFDASHQQQHDVTDAENGLKLMIDMVNSSTRYIVRVNTEDLTESVLNDVDVLIISTPDDDEPISHTEATAISEMLANGSSLFLMGDPTIDDNSQYWTDGPLQDMGENFVLNDLLDSINVTGVRFSINETESGDLFGDTMFDYEHPIFNSSYPQMIKLDTTTWDSNHPIFRNINELFTMTATLKPIELTSGIARGYETTFAQYKESATNWANYSYPNMTLPEFEQFPLNYSAINGTLPSWMSAFEYNESRIVVIGSTLMFTGRNLDFPETDLRWFYMGDNARLFMNIMNWLSYDFVEAPSAIVPMLIISTVIMVIGLVFYIFKKIR